MNSLPERGWVVAFDISEKFGMFDTGLLSIPFHLDFHGRVMVSYGSMDIVQGSVPRLPLIGKEVIFCVKEGMANPWVYEEEWRIAAAMYQKTMKLYIDALSSSVSFSPLNPQSLESHQWWRRVLDIPDEEVLTEKALKKYYRRAAKKVHPDKDGAHAAMVAVNQAYAAAKEFIRN